MPSNTESGLGKVQTLSIIAGSQACNARCDYCVSKMTPDDGIAQKPEPINVDRFRRAFEYAMDGQTETAMITGKGEPVLFPDHITEYLNYLLGFERHYDYTIHEKELQTNGICIAEGAVDNLLHIWRAANMQTIAVSIVHYDPDVNRKIFVPYREHYIDLPDLIAKLHGADFSVRLSCVLIKGGIDNSRKLQGLIKFAKAHEVEQLTIRSVNRPSDSRNPDVAKWVDEHKLEPGQLEDINMYLEENGTVVRTFPFGGAVYSIYNIRHQNVCSTTSLTKDPQPANYLRQLIFYPGGRIATDWTESGEGLK